MTISKYFRTEELISLGIGGVGKNVSISKDSVITGLENIFIGDNVRIDSFTIILAARGFLKIGSNVHIEPHSSLVAHFGITLGNFCTISHGVRLFTASADFNGDYFTNVFPDSKYQNPIKGEIVLEDHVIVGANSVVLPNLTISEGAAIGALSLVKKTLPGWGIYAGNPLKKLKDRNREIQKIGSKLL